MRHAESKIQRAVIQWFALAHRGLGVPHASLLFAIPNGGARNPATGAVLKAEGVRAGVADLMLACPRGGFSGLFIELKTTSGRVREEQKAFIALVIGQGYWAQVARGFDEARVLIERYLKETHT